MVKQRLKTRNSRSSWAEVDVSLQDGKCVIVLHQLNLQVIKKWRRPYETFACVLVRLRGAAVDRSAARPSAAGTLLSGQDDQSRRWFYFRRFLRPLVAVACAFRAQVSPRRSRNDCAEYARRRWAHCGKSRLQCGAARRSHRWYDLLRHVPGPDGRPQGGAIRRA